MRERKRRAQATAPLKKCLPVVDNGVRIGYGTAHEDLHCARNARRPERLSHRKEGAMLQDYEYGPDDDQGEDDDDQGEDEP